MGWLTKFSKALVAIIVIKSPFRHICQSLYDCTGPRINSIPEHHVPEFKKKLVTYYENADIWEIRDFLKEKCWRKIKGT